jgi:glycerol-1-phosphate dehydrogenase [NAD(P)+]
LTIEAIEELRIKLGASYECVCGKVHEVYTKKVILDKDAISKVPRIIDELNLSGDVIVVDDEITRKIAGVKLIDLLKQNGINVKEYVIYKPTIEEVKKVELTMNKCSYAMAVGGGSVIDTCKLASYRSGIPFFSIPTTLSHDGIVSATASIVDEEGVKKTYPARSPVAVVFDLDVLISQPRRMIASGCGDMLGKATSLKDWELAKKDKGEYYCPTAAKLSLMTYEDTIKYIQSGGKDVAGFAWTIFKSGIAMALIGSSRPNSGSEHIISHYIDTHSKNPAMHGEQVGIATILMSLYHSKHNPDWWTEEKYQWHYIKNLLELIGAPTTLVKIGIEINVLLAALIEGYKLRPDRYTILHKRPITRGEAESLIKSSCI